MEVMILLSENVVVKAEVILYEKEKPWMGRGKAGQLILTNNRLVYIKYVWKHLHAVVKDYTASIEEGLKNEESLEIPLSRISEAKAERYWGTPYLRVRYLGGAGEKACSFILAVKGGPLIAKSPINELAKMIVSLSARAK